MDDNNSSNDDSNNNSNETASRSSHSIRTSDGTVDTCNTHQPSPPTRTAKTLTIFVVDHAATLQVFFALMALCACCSREFNHGFWGFKFLLWMVLLVATLFITNDVFDTSGYVWVARVGAFVFTIMQQIVLIDLAYRWAVQTMSGGRG